MSERGRKKVGNREAVEEGKREKQVKRKEINREREREKQGTGERERGGGRLEKARER